MTLALAAAGLLLAVAAAASLAWAMQRPRFVAGLGRILAAGLLHGLAAGLRPRNFTPTQRQAIREGRDPFRDRPHGGHD